MNVQRMSNCEMAYSSETSVHLWVSGPLVLENGNLKPILSTNGYNESNKPMRLSIAAMWPDLLVILSGKQNWAIATFGFLCYFVSDLAAPYYVSIRFGVQSYRCSLWDTKPRRRVECSGSIFLFLFKGSPATYLMSFIQIAMWEIFQKSWIPIAYQYIFRLLEKQKIKVLS